MDIHSTEDISTNALHDSGLSINTAFSNVRSDAGDDPAFPSDAEESFSDLKNEMSRTFCVEDVRDIENDKDSQSEPKINDNQQYNEANEDKGSEDIDQTKLKDDSKDNKENENDEELISLLNDLSEDIQPTNNESKSEKSSSLKPSSSSKPKSSSHSSSGNTKKSNDRSYSRRVAGRKRSRVRSRSRTPVRRPQPPHPSDVQACRVFVANIQFQVTWQDLKHLFQQKVGKVEFVTLFSEENGHPRGCGIVDFSDPQSAERAVAIMNKYNFRNRKLVVKSDLGMERDRTGRIVAPSSRSHSYVSNNDTYGLALDFLNSLGITLPLSDRVFVANLKYCVQEKTLEEMFSMAGRIRKITLAREKSGKSRGFGTVQFVHPIEAVQAVSMFHKQMLFDRQITVRMDHLEVDPISYYPGRGGLPTGLGTLGKGLGVGGAPLQVANSNGAILPMNDRYAYGYAPKYYDYPLSDYDSNYSQYHDYRSSKSLPHGNTSVYPPLSHQSMPHQTSSNSALPHPSSSALQHQSLSHHQAMTHPPYSSPSYSAPSASYNINQQSQSSQAQQYSQVPPPPPPPPVAQTSSNYGSYNQHSALYSQWMQTS